MQTTLQNKKLELTKMPGFYMVSCSDTKTGKVVSYSIEDYWDALYKFCEIKKNIIKGDKK